MNVLFIFEKGEMDILVVVIYLGLHIYCSHLGQVWISYCGEAFPYQDATWWEDAYHGLQ